MGGAIFAGALGGLGDGLMEQAKAAREDALYQKRKDDRQAEREQNRFWNKQDREEQRRYEQGLKQKRIDDAVGALSGRSGLKYGANRDAPLDKSDPDFFDPRTGEKSRSGTGPGKHEWQGLEDIQAGIFKGESGGDYNALFGFSNRDNGHFSGTKLTDMTIDEALAFSSPRGKYGQWVKGKIGRVATPMGAYQIVGTTLRAAKDGLGLKGNEKMTMAMQDKLGRWIYDVQGTGAWEGYKGPATPSRAASQEKLPEKPQYDPGRLMAILLDGEQTSQARNMAKDRLDEMQGNPKKAGELTDKIWVDNGDGTETRMGYDKKKNTYHSVIDGRTGKPMTKANKGSGARKDDWKLTSTDKKNISSYIKDDNWEGEAPSVWEMTAQIDTIMRADKGMSVERAYEAAKDLWRQGESTTATAVDDDLRNATIGMNGLLPFVKKGTKEVVKPGKHRFWDEGRTATPAPTKGKSDPKVEEALQRARDAIEKGADPAKIKAYLKKNGIDPELL